MDSPPDVPQGGTAEKLTEEVPEVHQPTAPDRLSPALAFDMGRRSIQLETSELIDKHLGEQRALYSDPNQVSRAELVQGLIDRDRVIAQMGRMLTEGKMAANLLREFVRGQLYALDRGTPEAVQKLLEDTFGKKVMSTDARQLRMHGHNLGPSIDQRMDPEQHAIDTAATAPKGQIEGGGTDGQS